MEPATHYATLGLTPQAPLPVIKAAYKALVLLHHPDKTIHLAHTERAQHAAVFREVQEAYDVLSNVSLKASYDAELSRHGNRVDLQRSTFHRAPSSCSTYTTRLGTSTVPSTPKRRASVKQNSTTTEEKHAVRAKCDAELASMRAARTQRDIADAAMDIGGLRYTLKVWSELASQPDVKNNPLDAAYCQIKIHEYTLKVADREREHEEWLTNMAAPKPTRFSTPTSSSRRASTPCPSARPRADQSARAKQRAQEKKAAEEKKAADDAARAQARAAENARLAKLRDEQMKAKAAAVRMEKEKAKQKADEQAQEKAERIAKARAKAAPATTASKRSAGDTQQPAQRETGSKGKTCGRCGSEHVTLAEWKMCSVLNAKQSEDESFFTTV